MVLNKMPNENSQGCFGVGVAGVVVLLHKETIMRVNEITKG